MSDKNGIPHPDVFPGLAPTKEVVLNKVAEKHGLIINDLYKMTRKTEIVEPRHIAMSVMKFGLGISYDEIAAEFNQTKPNVHHGVMNVRNFFNINKHYRKKIIEIIYSVYAFDKERQLILKRISEPEIN